jgi:nucleoside-diphosphate-sugar epimerase
MIESVAQALCARQRRLRMPLSPFLLIATVLETVLRPLGVQPPLHRRRMDFFRKSFLFSRNRAREILGFEPTTSFQQGVIETAKWYKENGYL